MLKWATSGPGGAGELIAEAVLAIEMGCTMRDVAESIHPHPTLSETLAFAGEVYMGTATEIYKTKTTKKRMRKRAHKESGRGEKKRRLGILEPVAG